jgi:hypothetical protein
MKRIFFSLILSLALHCSLQSQEIPIDIRQKLDHIQSNVRIGLDEYRFRNRRGSFFYLLSLEFSDTEKQLIDSLGLKLSIGMIYDDDMRNRIVELLCNKYREYELDTIINRQIRGSIYSDSHEAFKKCKFDTLALFKTTLDSFFTDIKNKGTEDFKKQLEGYESFYKEKYKSDVFKLMKLDTTEIFKQAYNKVVEKSKNEIRDEYLTSMYYDGNYFAELCGYIGDQRFIQPLIESLEKPNDFQREKVIEALARMKVEPYYTEYVQKRTRTIDSIKKKKPDFDIEELVYVIGTQESFLELSEYLLSDVAYNYVVIDLEEGAYYKPNPMYNKAFDWISINLENNDLKDMIGNKYPSENPEIVKPVYDWMQKNYGKYKIKHLW